MEEDLHLWQELARARAPEALWSAYREFWQKAFEDYWNEYLTLSQLYAKVVTPGPQPLRSQSRNVHFFTPKRLNTSAAN